MCNVSGMGVNCDEKKNLKHFAGGTPHEDDQL